MLHVLQHVGQSRLSFGRSPLAVSYIFPAGAHICIVESRNCPMETRSLACGAALEQEERHSTVGITAVLCE